MWKSGWQSAQDIRLSFFFSSRRRHTRSVSAFLLNRSSDLICWNALETETVDASSAKSELTWSACLDHSSILPFPLYNPLVLDNDENEFVLRKNGKVI